METESKGETREIADAVSVSNGTAFQDEFAKQGLIKRFLKWIARGNEQSNMPRGSCPT